MKCFYHTGLDGKCSAAIVRYGVTSPIELIGIVAASKTRTGWKPDFCLSSLKGLPLILDSINTKYGCSGLKKRLRVAFEWEFHKNDYRASFKEVDFGAVNRRT